VPNFQQEDYMSWRQLHLIFVLAVALPFSGAATQEAPIKLGVMNDMSGVYADFQGIGSVIAARLAVEDFGSKLKGRPIEVISGDHQNKADIGAKMAREWFERDGVDVILDVPNSGIALAVSDIAREKNKVFIASGGVTSELTGKRCSPNTVQWTFDNWSLANGLVRAAIATGGETWFFLTSDYAFGHDLERAASAAVNTNGGKVLGSVRHPINTSDFSSFILQAQNSKAKIIALANAGGDTTNAVKQAAEFGVTKGGQRLAGLVFGLNNVHALGTLAAQGLVAVSPFYWNTNEATRAFARRFQAQHTNKNMPNEMQAGVYAAVLHYLRAVAAQGGDGAGDKVVAKMKELPTDDLLFGKGSIRADGRKLHPMYLLEVKSVAESAGPWDYFKATYTIPADQAFRPLSDGGCPLVN
jgi:branched-chain amino acid transport system substrate-binding protein